MPQLFGVRYTTRAIRSGDDAANLTSRSHLAIGVKLLHEAGLHHRLLETRLCNHTRPIDADQ
jgi:hypothetical protein